MRKKLVFWIIAAVVSHASFGLLCYEKGFLDGIDFSMLEHVNLPVEQ